MLALLGLLAGCGGSRHAAPPATTTAGPRHAPATPHARALLEITVIDGDRWTRLPGASVRLWGRSARTGPNGVAEIRVPWRRPLPVSVSVRGYGFRSVYADFRTHRRVTVRVYRPELQWPLYGVNGTRTQSQAFIRLRPPFKTVWAVPLGGLIEFPAVVSDGVAYIGNATATVHAISMVKGTVLWTHATPNGKMASSPAVVGRVLVYHGMNGDVFVLERATGRLLWHYDAGSPIESSPIVVGGIDYFGAWNGRLYALDLRTRRLRWSRELGAKITSSAAIAGGTLYIGDYAGRLWALSPRTGATRWVGQVNGRIYGTPAVANGRVFAPSSDGRSRTAFTTGGRELWRFSPGAYVYSSPAVWGGRVFVGSYNGVFYALSARTGATLWAHGTGGPISGAAVVVDGIAYAGSFAHRILGVDAATGKVVLDFPHGEYVPVAGGGQTLLLHGYSRVFAVERR